MEDRSPATDRREHTRVHAHGSVKLRDGDHELHGRLMMLSARALEVRCDLDVDPVQLVGKSVDLSLWWEQVGGWYALRGQVRHARVESHSLVVAVEEPSPDLLEAIERTLAEDGGHRGVCVMVVDTHDERRRRLARGFRELGCTVIEAGSRVEAIEYASDLPLDIILVADTAPENVGQDLRAYLALVYPAAVVLRSNGETDPPRVLSYARELRRGLDLE